MSGTRSSGARRPTLHDVARVADVSIKTASRVVNNIDTVDPVLASRVREAIVSLGYRPNQLASSLKSGAATSTIGLVLKDISNEFYASLTLGVASVAATRGSQVITSASDEDIDSDQERALIFDLCRRRVDGMIIVPRGGDYSSLKPEIEMGTPMVFVDRTPGGLDADAVLLDNRGGAAAAINELVRLGHRRIGLLFHSLDLEPIRLRLEGVRDALEAAGIEIVPELLESDVLGPEAAAEAAGRMLDLDDPPTAIFCAYNRITEGAVHAVWRRRSPTLVAGFDTFRFSDLVPVPLLLVAYDARAFGRAAAERLFARIGGDTTAPLHVTIPTHLTRAGTWPA